MSPLASVRRLLGSLKRRVVGARPSAPDSPEAAPPNPVPSAWADPWQPYPPLADGNGALCNICRWQGASFERPGHCEMATCPRCGSIARDRFLFWCFTERVDPASPVGRGARVLETSPRMGEAYRNAMDTWFDYTCSDYDLSAHRGVIQLDLQAIDLPDESVDVLLTPHVLEHVPDTGAALAEIHRVLAPGGRMYLQVPVLQGRTAPPETPEFHGDNTPVFWRFGYDLTATLRDAGFETSALVTARWKTLSNAGTSTWPDGETAAEFDVDDQLAQVVADDLTIVASDAEAARHGFEPAYMFLTWECVKDDASPPG